jgi:hypothetical protein
MSYGCQWCVKCREAGGQMCRPCYRAQYVNGKARAKYDGKAKRGELTRENESKQEERKAG